MNQYFYITINFYPQYDVGQFVRLSDDTYRNTTTGEVLKRRLLYDFGCEQEPGFQLIPPLSFSELISLVESPQPVPQKRRLRKYTKEDIRQANIWRNNLYGAVAVIMQDHVEELIAFLASKIATDYFSDPHTRDNFKLFSFDSIKTKEAGHTPGGVLSRGYEDILNDYTQWRIISSAIKEQVYG